MLPYPDQDAVPFTPILAEFYNETIANIEGLADWSAFDDGSFPISKIDANAEGFGFLDLKSEKLDTAEDVITVNFPPRKHLWIVFSIIPNGTINSIAQFNNDSTDNYAEKFSVDSGASVPAGPIGHIDLETSSGAFREYGELRVSNEAAQIKFGKAWVSFGSGGASSAPLDFVNAFKWDNTSEQITRFDLINNQTGSFDVGSEVKVFGKD